MEMRATEASYIFTFKLCIALLNFGEIGMMNRSSYNSCEVDNTAVTYHGGSPTHSFSHIYMSKYKCHQIIFVFSPYMS